MNSIFILSNEQRTKLVFRFLSALVIALILCLLIHFITNLLFPIIWIIIFIFDVIFLLFSGCRLFLDRFIIRTNYIIYYRSVFERKIYYENIKKIIDSYDQNIKLWKKRLKITTMKNKSYMIKIHKYENYGELLKKLKGIEKALSE